MAAIRLLIAAVLLACISSSLHGAESSRAPNRVRFRAEVWCVEPEQESFLFGIVDSWLLEAPDGAYAPGIRLTLTLPADATTDWDFSYGGMHHWSDTEQDTRGGEIISAFTSSGARDSNVLTSLTRSADLHNVEIDYSYYVPEHNVAVSQGIRYLQYDESMNICVSSNVGEDVHLVGTNNRILAYQAGLKHARRFGPFLFEAMLEGGCGVNFLSSSLQYEDDTGRVPGFNAADDGQTSWVTYLDLRLGTGLYLSENISIRVGYDVLAVNGLALTSDLLDRNRAELDIGEPYHMLMSPYQGSTILHGAWLAVEWVL